MKNTYKTEKREPPSHDGIFLLVVSTLLIVLGISYLTMKRVRATELKVQAIEQRMK